VELAGLTTLRLGGPARRLVEARDEATLVETVRAADAAGEPLLVLAGGSNVVVSDDGFPGTVVLVRTSGVAWEDGHLRVQAGEPWDALVARVVDEGWQGFECLAGIPGSTGATPIQNVGAYGQDVSETVAWVRVLDRATGEVVRMDAAECGFDYRTSVFKKDPRRIVLEVGYRLREQGESGPLRYAELARTLGVPVGATAPLADVREAVLGLRRGKGMVVDPSDRDSVSAGSFFTNPILTADAFAALEERAGEAPPAFPEPDGRIKTSAAWLIGRAGFSRGDGDGRVGISTKHTLALVNRGGATAAELVELARTIAARVHEAFGVTLVPEPVFVGLDWPAEPGRPA
jgi:UDP-N-acetylmuramate dehydrogenase